MRTEYYMFNRESIVVAGTTFKLTTHSIDMTTWTLAYLKGIREPRYTLPVPYQYSLDPETIGNDGVFANVVLRGKKLFDSGRRLDRWRIDNLMDYYIGSGQ